MTTLPIRLLGDELAVPCVDGTDRRYLGLDSAASTPALPAVAARVQAFVPWYSSVHRGAGYKSQMATAAYEEARGAALAFAGRPRDGGAGDERDDIAILCRNTTEAINHLAYRLRLTADDVVVSTVAEHHANLLPWARTAARRRYVECDPQGRFGPDEVAAVLDDGPRPALLAITAASNVTGWRPPLDQIIEVAHERGVPVLVDAAQVAAHQPLPTEADYLAWSGHKMYAPFGTGVLIGPRRTFSQGDPFLAGGGAVDLVDLDEVIWTDPPEREEAGSPNLIGAVALHTAIDELISIGWDAIGAHEAQLSDQLRQGLAAIDGVTLLGPDLDTPTLAVASFVVDDLPHALVAARLSAEFGIGVRHGCFCAHPYLVRLLGLSGDEIARYHDDIARGDRTRIPGAVRASAGLSTTPADVDRFLAAVAVIAGPDASPVEYQQDPVTGDFWPGPEAAPWSTGERSLGAACSRG
jgi:selenocysteine lyase/cysteine desulfurase